MNHLSGISGLTRAARTSAMPGGDMPGFDNDFGEQLAVSLRRAIGKSGSGATGFGLGQALAWLLRNRNAVLEIGVEWGPGRDLAGPVPLGLGAAFR